MRLFPSTQFYNRELSAVGVYVWHAQFYITVLPYVGVSIWHAQFQAAREAAEEVGAQMVLGDRPIEITVRCLLP